MHKDQPVRFSGLCRPVSSPPAPVCWLSIRCATREGVQITQPFKTFIAAREYG
ncbi:hypothetical protein [Bradyrhizobium sp. CW1]|uniref:hypothetical protein n=1 Tax=Bradyrhizobium sp. CW1 TaxID=2782686 RepID=UPI001FFFBE13|nr:hypothetical protein [Bradyrhizobium sp. CW1]